MAMALKQRLELRLQQKLALTPGLRMRLSILRMSPLELAEEVAREAARNPFLILDAPREPPNAAPRPEVELAAPAAGFQEDLRQQLARQTLPPRIAAVAEFLIGELRDDGFLDVELAQLAEEISLPLDLLEMALLALQACEPPGIAARSLRECLRLQLVGKGLSQADAALTVTHLEAFGRKDWPTLSKALGLSQAALKARAALLKGLRSRPVPEAAPLAAIALRADLRLERQGDGALSVVPERAARPGLQLDAAMIRRAEADGFAPELLIRARTMIEALEQRGRTLARIGDWLVQNQQRFFSEGPAGLAPASRVGLAADLQLHPSTVSRAVSGKAIDVDGRLWPLSVFFSSALQGTQGPVSARAVQKRLADMIATEPAGHPYSDETLVEKLNAQGVDIARRTVAKYRQGLRIPSSAKRRRLATANRDAKDGE